MKIVNEHPPNYEAIVKQFPAVKDMPGVVFTYGNTIYVPNGSQSISKDLMVHESYHSEQQGHTSPEEWWATYLKDPAFRAEEELQAYQRQYKKARKYYSKAMLSHFLERIATDLSGPMYGGIYTLETAKRLITKENS